MRVIDRHSFGFPSGIWRRRIIAASLISTGISFVTGCSSKDSTAPPPDPHALAAGVYYMVAYNNSPLPATAFSNAAGRVEVSGGNMTLRSDKSYTETRIFRLVLNSGAPPETSSSVENGTFAIVGTQITWSIPPSGSVQGLSYTGAISGDVLSYTYNGASYRYQR